MPIFAGGRQIQTRGLALTTEQTDRIARTLNQVPPEHLRSLQYLSFRDRDAPVLDEHRHPTGEMRPYAGGSTSSVSRGWQALEPGERRFLIVIDIDSFSPLHRPINCQPGGLHYTLLHELGHLVDWSYAAFAWIQANDPAGFATIAARAHTGITRGAQERFADVYADMVFYPESQRATNDAMRSVLASPAFTALSTPWTRRP